MSTGMYARHGAMTVVWRGSFSSMGASCMLWLQSKRRAQSGFVQDPGDCCHHWPAQKPLASRGHYIVHPVPPAGDGWQAAVHPRRREPGAGGGRPFTWQSQGGLQLAICPRCLHLCGAVFTLCVCVCVCVCACGCVWLRAGVCVWLCPHQSGAAATVFNLQPSWLREDQLDRTSWPCRVLLGAHIGYHGVTNGAGVGHHGGEFRTPCRVNSVVRCYGGASCVYEGESAGVTF